MVNVRQKRDGPKASIRVDASKMHRGMARANTELGLIYAADLLDTLLDWYAAMPPALVQQLLNPGTVAALPLPADGPGYGATPPLSVEQRARQREDEQAQRIQERIRQANAPAGHDVQSRLPGHHPTPVGSFDPDEGSGR